MKKLSPFVVLVVLAYGLWEGLADPATAPKDSAASRSAPPPSAAAGDGRSDAILRQAFRDRRGDLQVQGVGTVRRVLPDDNEGSRHQRFLLELASGQTLLVAHNIDLAPRIPGLSRGDRVAFYGEYEWNDRGGVIHWTHHDPRGTHPGGWLEHEGRRYE
jgi:hypothetical protein